METTFGLLSVLVAIAGINVYVIVIGELLLYMAILYFVFFRLKNIPEFKLWLVLLVFLFFFMPKNFFYTYTLDELRELAKIIDIEKAGKIMFRFIFALFAYIKYYRIKE